jgi:hypothetical protein
MNTPTSTPTSRTKKRYTFLMHLWPHGQDSQEWVCEVHEVSTGETAHVHSLEALLEWLKQKTSQPRPTTPEPATPDKLSSPIRDKP